MSKDKRPTTWTVWLVVESIPYEGIINIPRGFKTRRAAERFVTDSRNPDLSVQEVEVFA